MKLVLCAWHLLRQLEWALLTDEGAPIHPLSNFSSSLLAVKGSLQLSFSQLRRILIALPAAQLDE